MIEVQQEKPQPSYFELENCCFCRKPTPFWYTPNDVACCPACAEFADAQDVPTKAVWLRRERIAEGMRWNAVTRNWEQTHSRRVVRGAW